MSFELKINTSDSSSEDLTQPVPSEEQLKQYALEFIESNQLLVKYLLWLEMKKEFGF
jgi:hypothetical protein